MILAKDLRKRVRAAAIKWAIAHYEDAVKPRTSVITAAAEAVSDSINDPVAAPIDVVTREFVTHAERALNFLTDTEDRGAMR